MDKKDKNKNVAELKYFFNPRSIALVGVSKDIRKPSGRSLNALLKWGYEGEIYPINPRYQEINGIICYPSLRDITSAVDMAIISIPAESVLESLTECIAKKVKAVVIFTSGFAEIGPEGKKLQQRVTTLARENNLRILGPNCVGLVNLSNSVMASFANIVDLQPVYPMTLGFVTQSGAFGTLIFAQAVAAGVGFSSFVSVGNEADTEFADFLSYLLTTPETKVIGGYLEGAKNGGKLRRAAQEALELAKPLLIMKVGRTGAGARAASSHTGSLAGDDLIYDAFFRQLGIIRIESLNDLTSFVIIHRSGRFPAGNNIGILSISGGAGVLMADKSESIGLNVPEFTGATLHLLETYLPSFGSAKNPVDLTSAAVAEPEMLGKCLRAIVADENIHMIVVATGFMPHMAPILAKDIIEIYRSTSKPIVLIANIFSSSEVIAKAIKAIEDAGIPVLKDHLHTIQALKNLAWYSQKARQAAIKTDRLRIHPDSAIREMVKSPAALTEFEAKKILSGYGIPVTREALATSADMAVRFAREIGYPVALKIQSPQIMHKTEARGIKLNVASDSEVRSAFQEILANARKYTGDAAVIQGILVQEMLQSGVEVIIGTNRDPVFGHVLMFGLGGIYVEAMQDVSFRITPLNRNDAQDMIHQIRGFRVLQGMRGKPPVDMDALVDVILRVSALVSDYGDVIDELDINPLIVSAAGAKAADALIVKQQIILTGK
jgi:acetate---CoA ligase (ADP-forming)